MELTAGESRLLDEADPEALSKTIKSVVGVTEAGLAATVVKTLPSIPPEVARLVLKVEINKSTMGQFEGKLQRGNVEIMARLAAAHAMAAPPR